jgi:hypothetical protein
MPLPWETRDSRAFAGMPKQMPEYSSQALRVINALKTTQELDETIWLDRALLALSELMPESAIGYALHRPNVWGRERRLQLRRDGPPNGRRGFLLADLADEAEAAAAAHNSQIVTEVHIACALASHGPALLELGLVTDQLIQMTLERSGPTPGAPVIRHPGIVGVAREAAFQSQLDAIDLQQVLAQTENAGRVERKRSIVNRRPDQLVAQVEAAVGLVNANRDSLCFIVFGQEDNGAIVGQLNHDLQPIEERTVTGCQEAFVARLMECKPPVIVKWGSVERDGKRVVIACMGGRERSRYVQTPHGTYPIRSGEGTHHLSHDAIVAVARESLGDVDRPSEISEPPVPDEHIGGAEGATHRRALQGLRDSVNAFLASPPDIPQRVEDSRKLDNWRPVVDPILTVFAARIEELVRLGIAADDDGLVRLSRGLRDVFSLRDQQRGGVTWIIEAPRLVTRLIADQIMADAYMTERWDRIATLGRHMFASYVGRVPWVTAPEFRHLQAVGGNADVAGPLSLTEAVRNFHRFEPSGAGEANIRAALSAVSLGLGMATMAREEANNVAVHAPWITLSRELWRELEAWEEMPEMRAPFALLAGEYDDVFASRIFERLTAILSAFQSSGYFLGTVDDAVDAAKRIADDGAKAKRRREIESSPL